MPHSLKQQKIGMKMSYQQWTVEKHIMQPYNEIQCKDEEVPLRIMLYGLQEHI